MSKIKNNRLYQYGTGPFEQQQLGTTGVEGVNDKWWRQHGYVSYIVFKIYYTQEWHILCLPKYYKASSDSGSIMCLPDGWWHNQYTHLGTHWKKLTAPPHIGTVALSVLSICFWHRSEEQQRVLIFDRFSCSWLDLIVNADGRAVTPALLGWEKP